MGLGGVWHVVYGECRGRDRRNFCFLKRTWSVILSMRICIYIIKNLRISGSARKTLILGATGSVGAEVV